MRRAESTARVVLHRAFAAVSSLIPHIRKAAQAALQPNGAGMRSPKAKTTRDEDDYEDDFDEVSTVALVTECDATTGLPTASSDRRMHVHACVWCERRVASSRCSVTLLLLLLQGGC